MSKKLLKAAISTALFLALTTVAFASASDVSIQIESPKSPTNQSSFNVNFVTLDTQNRSITVKCFKKGPSEGGFSQFGSDIALAAGGNTGNCSVNSSILNTDGTYQFYATATAGGDSATSSAVSVTYNTQGPGTPTNYSREQPSSCIYRIKFKTADDSGKTVKVEIYRSENTSFNADSGTRVATVSIGSNTEGSSDITSPDCTKTYYFAVRAFDSSGNGSGIVGDSVTITTNSTVTTSTGSSNNSSGAAIITASNQINNLGGSVLGEEDSQVLGEATKSSVPSPRPSTQPSFHQDPPPPEAGLFNFRNVAVGIGFLILIALIIWRFAARNKIPIPPASPPPTAPDAQ